MWMLPLYLHINKKSVHDDNDECCCFLFNFACWVILHAILSSVDFFFFNYFFQKNHSGIPSECQTVWIMIRPDILSGLIWVKAVFKAYQQTTKVATNGES